jgi:hypothetical protein
MGLIAEVVIHLTFEAQLITQRASLTTLFRQSKLMAGRTFTPLQLKASHLREWGSRLKRTTSSSFAHRLTSERVCSTIIVGVPALISFVVPSVKPVHAPNPRAYICLPLTVI